jgi:hypothetical protein
MVALAAGILGEVDPVSCVGRACLAFLLGWIGAQVWNVMLMGSGATWRSRVAPPPPVAED